MKIMGTNTQYKSFRNNTNIKIEHSIHKQKNDFVRYSTPISNNINRTNTIKLTTNLSFGSFISPITKEIMKVRKNLLLNEQSISIHLGSNIIRTLPIDRMGINKTEYGLFNGIIMGDFMISPISRKWKTTELFVIDGLFKYKWTLSDPNNPEECCVWSYKYNHDKSGRLISWTDGSKTVTVESEKDLAPIEDYFDCRYRCGRYSLYN